MPPAPRITPELGTSQLDLLVMSQGFISSAGRETNTEQPRHLQRAPLRYYSRVRLAAAPTPPPRSGPRARVISILAGGLEGTLIADDLDPARHYSLTHAAAQSASLMTLSRDPLATQHPAESSVHAYPGARGDGLAWPQRDGVGRGVLVRWGGGSPILGLAR
ncbi:hypothetical protein LTR53_003433 [Teratosphaeriaceae sp. CCFEE 6253]|nr:hypothetical protein LTR53_003433 [Teratosphaeriaceae sp. CCFEE 6253]